MPSHADEGQYAEGEIYVSAATRSERARQQQQLQQQEQVHKKQRVAEDRARPKLRHRRSIKVMQLLMTFIFLLAVGSALFFMYSRYQIDRPGPLAESATFEVAKGQGLSTIAENLEQMGIVRDRKLFAVNVVASKKAKRLKAGRYMIPERASMQQVLDILVAGRAIYNQVTVVEGTTSEQTVELLRAHPLLSGEIVDIPPEGSLMPETYQFSDGMDRNALLEQMRKAQSEFLAEKWLARQEGLPIKTPEEALTLASIVEKETGVPEERGKVAGVFMNRLRKGMKLQSDPTIIYGLVRGKGKLGRPLLRSELNQKTEYNTYQISGLPPTPIANPGRAAIEAVLNPDQTDYIYFVADGTGGHAFAATLKDHQNNVVKWRQVEAERRKEAKRKAEEEKLATPQQNAAESAGLTDASTGNGTAGITVQSAADRQKSATQLSVTTSADRPDTSAPEAAPDMNHGWGLTVPLPSRKPRH